MAGQERGVGWCAFTVRRMMRDKEATVFREGRPKRTEHREVGGMARCQEDTDWRPTQYRQDAHRDAHRMSAGYRHDIETAFLTGPAEEGRARDAGGMARCQDRTPTGYRRDTDWRPHCDTDRIPTEHQLNIETSAIIGRRKKTEHWTW